MKSFKKLFSFIMLISIIFIFTSCQSENYSSINNTSNNNSTDTIASAGNVIEEDYNKLFELKLYSDKQTYRTKEKVIIWATLEYIGSNNQIKIWHSNPYISFTITDGKKFNTGGFFDDVLRSTVLEKGKLYRFDYQKSGGYSADDPMAEYWKKFYEEKDLYLPEGEYTVKVSSAFSLSENPQKSKNSFFKELKLKIED